MIAKKFEMREEIKENMRGGNGAITLRYLVPASETFGKSRMIAELTMPKGASIGPHDHVGETEMYIITEGQAYVTENNEGFTLNAGDVMYTGNGDFHSIENKCENDLVLYAVIFN